MKNYWIIQRLNFFLKLYFFNIFEKELEKKEKISDAKNLKILKICDINQIQDLESPELVKLGFNFSRDKEIIKKNGTVFYTFYEGELAHVTHVFDGPNADFLHPLNFAMSDIKKQVGLAAFTNPNYRRKGLHILTRKKAFEYLIDSGCKFVWDVQEKINHPVRRSVLKMGYYLWGTALRVRFFLILYIDIVFKKNKFLPIVKTYFKFR